MNDSGGQTLRVRFNQFVRAPLQRVYAAYVTPALMAKWMGLPAITDVSGPLDRPGATFVGGVFGPSRPRSAVLAAEPPVLHEMGGRTLLEFGYRWTARFAEKDDGTEIIFDSEVTCPACLIRRWVRRPYGGGGTRVG